ncbi:MAG TPA: gamma-glutamyltransferase, partial [Burkholderiaceae bacterium]|nr:gamma-glutamyltransferase [Burkholderiaceae bacterium]
MQRIHAAKADGFDAVDMHLWRDKPLDAIVEATAAAGVQVFSFSVDPRASLVNPAEHASVLAAVRDAVPVARRLNGARMIVASGFTMPGVPNAFKLIGAEANAVAAGKRPLSSMSPTLVLKHGKPLISVGAAGGPTIITQTVQALVGIIDFNKTPAESLALPRIHHQWAPDSLKIETSFGDDVLKELEARGHTLERSKGFG